MTAVRPTVTPSDPPQEGSDSALVFGRYRVLRPVGEGGMGTVFEAEHIDLGRRVALKVLRAEHLASEQSVKRFLREGRATSKLKHPNAVETYDVGFDNKAGWLVMEFLDGETLAERLERAGRIDPTEAVDIVLPVISAVSAAHALGIVHRDLKPSNIVLARGAFGEVIPKVVDFGIIKVGADLARTDNELTGNAAMLGTPMYMPPEQIRGAKNVGPASDQYSIGVILYRIITGAAPFEGRDVFEMLSGIMKGHHKRPRTLVPTLKIELESVIGRAMRPDQADRFGSMREFALALLPFASPAVRAAWGPRFEAMEATSLFREPTPVFGVEEASGRIFTEDTSKSIRRATRPPPRPVVREAKSAVTVALAIIAVALLVLGIVWWAQRPTLPMRPTTETR